MTAQMLYLAMVLAAFAAFIVTLATVSVWAWLAPKPRAAPKTDTVRPRRQALVQA